MGLGTGEIIMLIAILLIVFSASRMSALGNALGRFVYSFKKASHGDAFVDVKAVRSIEKGTVDGEVINEPPRH